MKLTRLEFLENLKANMEYVKDNYPQFLDEYRDGVYNISWTLCNDCVNEVTKSIQEFKCKVGEEK